MRRSVIEPKVKFLLETNPLTRDDDHYLYYMYVVGEQVGVTFTDAFVNYKFYGLAPYHSIARARRKIQEKNPDLRGDVEKKLKEEIEYYNQYKGD